MKRILTIQDISCLGQCSLTVALPIISAFGIEASVLPTAVLSTHTMFKNFTFADLTEEMPKIEKHWNDEGLKFDGFYTGYIGSIKQIEYISNIMDSCRNENAINVVDPCMADHGKLYPGFSTEFPSEMLKLCKKADVIVPNLTEACLLLGIEYRHYEKFELENIAKELSNITNASVILTGVSFEEDKLGALIYDVNDKSIAYYFTNKVPVMFHGTGDCFASSFFGALIKGYSLFESTKIACEFTAQSIQNTYDDKDTHWYGVHFEESLKYLTNL
jgi:pyridoxine kinase